LYKDLYKILATDVRFEESLSMLQIADLANTRDRVFPTHARTDRYYPSVAAEEARGVLTRCLDRGEGPALLIGAAGTGKSMLLQVLAEALSKDRPVVCLTSAQLCTRRALLQSILFELGQPYRQRDEGDLRLTLNDYLSKGCVGKDGAQHDGVLLLVDEAQALPDHLLEELRALGNMANKGIPTVRLLLAGSQALEEKFAEPAIEVFNQRIVARCYLAPFNHHDTAQYIRGHIAAAGGDPDQLLTADALDAVYHATSGIARLINQLCDRALLIGAAHGQMRVDKEIIQGAWADLQQLPTPWNLPDDPATPARQVDEHEGEHYDQESDEHQSIVEFGPLSDDHSPAGAESSFAPSARVYEPADEEATGPLAEFSTPEVAEVAETPATAQPAQSPSVSTPSTANRATAKLDDLFGGDFDEEVVIEDFAPLASAIPPSRVRVTNKCEEELGQLLHEVQPAELKSRQPVENAFEIGSPGESDDESKESTVVDRIADNPGRFSVVSSDASETESPALPADFDVDLPQLAASSHATFDPCVSFADGDSGLASDLDIDDTELDEEFDGLLNDAAALAETACRATKDCNGTGCSKKQPNIDELGIIVLEEEMAVGVETAAAHRADYRQLFHSLRDN